MWSVVIILLCSSLTSCTDIPEIKLEIDDLKCIPIVLTKLILNEKFHITVRSSKQLKYGSCSYPEQKINIYWPGNSFYVRTVALNASIEMINTTTWTCKFITYWYSYEILCQFDLNIVRAPVLEVNGNIINTNEMAAEKIFQSSAIYTFIENEAIKVTCRKSGTFSDYLQLGYSNGNQIFITDPEQYGPIEMYLKLTVDNNGTRIDCKVVNETRALGHTPEIRLYLKLKNGTFHEGILGFQVNDLILAQPKIHNEILYFNYEYFEGEQIEIASLRDENKYGQVKCNFSENLTREFEMKILNSPDSDIHYKLKMKLYDKISLSCTVEVKYSQDTSSTGDFVLELVEVLDFVPGTVNPTHNLIGLSTANILVKFNKNEDTTEILYEYINTEVLFLRCVSPFSRIQWDYQSAEVDKIDVDFHEHKTSPNIKEIQSKFRLMDNKTSSVIKCVTPKMNNVNLGNVTTAVELIRKAPKKKHVKIIVVVSGAAVVLTIILVATTIILLRKRREAKAKQAMDASNVNYETLPGCNESAKPMTRQQSAENAAVPRTVETSSITAEDIAKTLNKMYSKPIPKSQRTKPKDLSYAELEMSETSEVSAYATVEYGSDETRAEVIPNRNANNYVKVLPVNKTSEPETKNLNATLRSKSKGDPNKENCDNVSKKYDNVFENNRYVNARSECDYAEPAYCEINVKK